MANNETRRRFVLIGGMPRSGTTLVKTVVGSHSRIAIPPGDFPYAERGGTSPDARPVLENAFRRAYDLLGRRDEALEMYRRVLTLPDRHETHLSAEEGISTPYTADRLD